MKKDIQDILDDLVKTHKDKKKILTYYGENIEDFTKEELIAVIGDIQSQAKHSTSEHDLLL